VVFAYIALYKATQAYLYHPNNRTHFLHKSNINQINILLWNEVFNRKFKPINCYLFVFFTHRLCS